jgi:hypothetical protein
LLLAAANAFYRMGEESDRQPGRTVEIMLSEVGQPPDTPWDVAFVHHVGYWSHYENHGHYSFWPLPATASAEDLGRFAKERGVLVEDPEEGDVCLIWSPRTKGFVNAGIVIRPVAQGKLPNGREYIRCVTIQGDASRAGAPRGRLVLRIKRDFCPAAGDRFIRWTSLDTRAALSDVTADVAIMAGRHQLLKAA